MEKWMKILKFGLIAAVTALMAACGGDTLDDGTTSNFKLRLVPGLTTPLSSGGQMNIEAEILDHDRTYLATPVEIQFESICAPLADDGDGGVLPGDNGNKASITPAIVTTGSGRTTVVYRDKGCGVNDVITARAAVGGENLVASFNIEILPANIGALEFKSATPASIGIEGSGLPQQSTLVFLLKDYNGNPIANKKIEFALENVQGDAQLVYREAFSDHNGEASTILRAGRTPMTARVKASTTTDTGYVLVTQADAVAISTGVSSQERFSMAVDNFSPEAGQCDGVPVEFTVRAADRDGYPVHGQVVQFSTEAGKIVDSCTLRAPTLDDDGSDLEGSVCSVTWTSQGQRPHDGRVTILATMEGEESFTDHNGNKLYDHGEPFESLPEAWRDDNENRMYDLGEEFLDANRNGVWDDADKQYFKGTLCTADARAMGHCRTGADVRQSTVIVMANSNLEVNINPTGYSIYEGGAMNGTISVCSVHGTGTSAVRNFPPAGTKIRIIGGSTVKDIIPSGDIITPSSNARGCYVTGFTFAAGSVGMGYITVEAETPGEHCGSIISRNSALVEVRDKCSPGNSPRPPECKDEDEP